MKTTLRTLLLPLAIPAYLNGYVYTWLLDVAGPVQTTFRDLTGLRFGQYWMPEIRSLPGAAVMLAMVLYPYVYLLCRAAFLQQSVCLLEASRTLGHGLVRTFLHVALPLARLDHALVRELEREVPSLLEYEGDDLVIKHLYIERRMIPLNLYLQNGNDEEIEHGVKEYGNAVKELMKANIFPGDMLYKNFGITRQGRVVFYD